MFRRKVRTLALYHTRQLYNAQIGEVLENGDNLRYIYSLAHLQDYARTARKSP